MSSETTPHVPEFLQRRYLFPNPSKSKGYLMDVEVVLLSLLDDQGHIPSASKLGDFMMILTRIQTVDHRVLAMEIIRHHMAEDIQKLFVSFGGYRLLKDWLEEAEENNYLHLLIALIKLCRILPFDKSAIKQSEIGKTIKRLSKYESSRNAEHVEILRHEIDMIMKEWRDKQQLASQLEKELVSETKLKEEQEIARAREHDESEKKKVRDLEVAKIKLRQEKEQAAIKKNDEENKMDVVEVEEVKEIKPVKRVLSSGAHPPVAVVVPPPTPAPVVPPPVKVPSRSTPLLTALLQQQAIMQPNAFNSGGTHKSSRSKRSLDMAEGARKLLSQENSDPVVLQVIDLNVKPLAKGGLKKKDEGSSKKEKKIIRWADEEGGNLREVQTIEVEKIKSSVANYKSHKDLVKRERQIEKETHLSKTSEAMHATTAWRMPKQLALTIDIIDNIGHPDGCIEIATQTKRLSILMETKYLDESLIPSDPDKSLADEDFVTNQGSVNLPISIPWLMNDEIDEDALLTASLRPQFAPSSSFQSSTFQSTQNFGPTTKVDYSSQIERLPRIIQMLDPMTLQMVLDDPFVLQSLMRPDGSINEMNLDILQNCASVGEYKEAISFVSVPTFAPPSWQNGNMSMQSSGLSNTSNMYATPLQSNNWAMNGMNSQIANMGMASHNNMTPVSSGFSMPSVGLDISTIDGSRLTKPANKSSLSTRATVPCKFFNTSRGCANGDKCPFGHFRQNAGASGGVPNSMTASIVSNLMGENANQRRGPGNFRGPGGRGPGQKGSGRGFRS